MTFSLVTKATLVMGCSIAIGAVVAFAAGPLVWAVLLAAVVVTVLLLPVSWSSIPWWMHPGWALLLGVAPGVALAVLLSDEYFLSHWSEPKLFASEHLLLTAVLVTTFVIGVAVGPRLLGSQDRTGGLTVSPDVVALLERSARVLFCISMIGYIIWIALGLSRGLNLATVTGTLEGSSRAFYNSRNAFLEPVAGVTTLTQFGPLVVTLLLLLRRLDAEIRVGRYLFLLFGLAIIRAVLHGERLAILELLIPIVVVAIALPRQGRTSHRRRALAALVPLWIPVGLLVFFGTFEYFRTWSHTYRDQYGNDGFAAFTLDRLAGYYATAPNNSALLLRQDTGQVPYWVIEWFWNLPGVSSVYPPETLPGPQAFGSALAGQANVEFNNPGGVLVPIADLGVPGAVVFWLVAGMGLGITFHLFRRASLAGLLLYPILFIGLLEGGRVLYWTSGRAVPSIVGAVVLIVLVRALASRESELATRSGTSLRLAHRPKAPSQS